MGTGVAALLLTIFTNHETGVFPILPYRFHLAVDFAVGVVFLAAPSLLHFRGADALYYWINGATVVTVISLSAPEMRAARA